ncbi:hypothetical protein R69927_07430 [Paraburkholderia domus]|uniref:hypothetical protein n=1 Tax=Paraburkholderia domus TaxID=2793075 RepID=UPI001913B9A5|nr:hypothetical protein [Paraburkholderia domus]MBK5091420.1 hypothetical protein [Burkholderia sp. R-69927]CAE6936073.1 hypothetical protein R69927_07430 [Paraburkholderia domus]
MAEVQQTAAADTGSAVRRSSSKCVALKFAAGLVVVVLEPGWLAHWWIVGRFVESTDDAYLQAGLAADGRRANRDWWKQPAAAEWLLR